MLISRSYTALPPLSDMSTAADADDAEVDAAVSSVGALHMNPLCGSGGAGAACAQWSRQQATAAFATHVGNALSLALGAEACDNQHIMVVVLAMKKEGLVPPGSRQEGLPALAHARSTAFATDENCVALAVTQASRAGRTGPLVWPVQLISENCSRALVEMTSMSLSLTVVWILDVAHSGPCRQACRQWRGRSTEW